MIPPAKRDATPVNTRRSNFVNGAPSTCMNARYNVAQQNDELRSNPLATTAA